jgi:uncharacterized Zn finger protein (UPF0148 family)
MQCPLCGGDVFEEDGTLICVAPGICTWTKEADDENWPQESIDKLYEIFKFIIEGEKDANN